ncbi:hypothetical protein GEMRC1_013132 [Eukaryota sp. GEM-RC1]
MKEDVAVFVLLKSVKGPFYIKGYFNHWSSPVPLTQLGHGCCWFTILEKRPFTYKYYSTVKKNQETIASMLPKNPFFVDRRLTRNADFSAGEMLIALADVLHSGFQYINDRHFLCRVARCIYEMALTDGFVSDVSQEVPQDLVEGIEFAINVLLAHSNTFPLLIDCLASYALSHHTAPLNQGLLSFRKECLSEFIHLASSPFPHELSLQLCGLLIDILPRSYIALVVHHSLRIPLLDRLLHGGNSLLLAKFLYKNWTDDLLSPNNFSKSIGSIVHHNPHALGFFSTHLHNKSPAWTHLKEFKPTESVVKAVPTIVEFVNLDTANQSTLISVLEKFIQDNSIHRLFHVLVLGLPKIFHGWSRAPSILRYLNQRFTNFTFNCLESLIEPPLGYAFEVLQFDPLGDPLSEALKYFTSLISDGIDETCLVGDILVLKEGNNFEKFIANLPPSRLLKVDVGVESSFRSKFNDIFAEIEIFQYKLSDLIIIADVFELYDEAKNIQDFKNLLHLSCEKLSKVLSNPVSPIVSQIVSALMKEIQIVDDFSPESVAVKFAQQLCSVICLWSILKVIIKPMTRQWR